MADLSEAASEDGSGDLRSCTLHVFADEWGRPVDPSSLVACGEPAIALVISACPHEHIDRALACAGCAAELQRAADVLVCARCEDGPEPHECKVTTVIRWLAVTCG